MSDIKIQINSAEALERLIGKDPELEIQIKNAIVQDFGRKYIKAMYEEEIQKRIREGIQEVLNGPTSPLQEYIKMDEVYRCTGTDRLKMKVKEYVDYFIGRMIHERIQAMSDQIRETVETNLKVIKGEAMAQISDEALKESIEREVKRRITKLTESL